MWRIRVGMIRMLLSLGGEAIYYTFVIILNAQVGLQMLHGESISPAVTMAIRARGW